MSTTMQRLTAPTGAGHPSSMRAALKALCVVVLGLGLAVQAGATTLMQTDLPGLTRTAHRIFSGKVVSAEPGMVQVGGGELPVIHYVIEVSTAFKGEVEDLKGRRVVRLTQLGKLPAVAPDAGVQHRAVVPGMPQLIPGERYLLFTTRPGASGLSATVGLGQGCFRITGPAGEERAVNGFDNVGLWPEAAPAAGKSTPPTAAAPAPSGPLPLSELATRIQAELAATETP